MIIIYIQLNTKKQCFECFSFYFQSNWSARMDFLATYAAVNLDGALISKEITGIMGCQVGLSKDLYGSDLQAKSTSGKVHIFREGHKILTVCTAVKSKGKISQNFVAFSEYMNFKTSLLVKFRY